jgi:hypothetical protein
MSILCPCLKLAFVGYNDVLSGVIKLLPMKMYRRNVKCKIAPGASRLVAIMVLLLTLSANAQTIRYVKQGGSGDGLSWATASGNLQGTMNAAASGDQVWVAFTADSQTTITAQLWQRAILQPIPRYFRAISRP